MAAPVIPPRAVEPDATSTPASDATSTPASETSEPAPAIGTPLVATPSSNPLRKQTLLGIAPVVTRAPPAGGPEPTEAAAAIAVAVPPGPIAEPASMSSIATPTVATTDAPTSHDDLPELQPRRPRWLLPLGIAAAIGLGVVGLRQLDRAPTPVPAELAQPVKAAKTPVAAATPERGAGDDPAPSDAVPSDAAPSVPAPSANAAEGAPPAASTGAIRINVDSNPAGARLFWKGKEVGTTPFVLELQPGERHAYELGLPGYTTRKVVIDGSKTDIRIGLRPVPAATSGGTRRK